MCYVAHEVRELLASLGLRSLDEAIGRVDLLRQRTTGEARADALDMAPLLREPTDGEAPRRFVAHVPVQRPRLGARRAAARGRVLDRLGGRGDHARLRDRQRRPHDWRVPRWRDRLEFGRADPARLHGPRFNGAPARASARSSPTGSSSSWTVRPRLRRQGDGRRPHRHPAARQRRGVPSSRATRALRRDPVSCSSPVRRRALLRAQPGATAVVEGAETTRAST